MGDKGSSKNILKSGPGHRPPTVSQKLAQALIKNALASLKESLRRKRKKETPSKRTGKDLRWFISTDEKPCSFIWCCETLRVEPDYLRKLILPS